MKIKSLLAVTAVALATVAASSAYATLFSGSATYGGLTFTFTQTDSDTLTFEVAGTPSDADGAGWAGVQYLGAFDLKDIGLNFSSATAIANGPGAVNLAGLNSQLSASNIDCSKTTGEKGTICFDIAPDVPLGGSSFDFTYTIDFSAPLTIATTGPTAGPHLQIAFMNTQGGDKVGSLYSQNVNGSTDVTDVTDVTDSTDVHIDTFSTDVPEPGTVALFAIALLALGLSKRRQAR